MVIGEADLERPLAVAGQGVRRQGEARQLEHEVAGWVNEAYGLSPEEVSLLWETAPPRMPSEPPEPE